MRRYSAFNPPPDKLQIEADRLLRAATGSNAYTTDAIYDDNRRWLNHHDQYTTEAHESAPQTTAHYDDHLDLLDPNKLIALALKSKLTTRQWGVFTLWQEGNNVRQIGDVVGIGKSTAARELQTVRCELKRVWEADTNPYRDLRDMLIEVFGVRAYRLVYG